MKEIVYVITVLLLVGCSTGKILPKKVNYRFENQVIYPTKFNIEENEIYSPFYKKEDDFILDLKSSLIKSLYEKRLVLDTVKTDYYIGIDSVSFSAELIDVEKFFNEEKSRSYVYVDYTIIINIFDSTYSFIKEIKLNDHERQRYIMNGVYFTEYFNSTRINFNSTKLEKKIRRDIANRLTKEISKFVYRDRFAN